MPTYVMSDLHGCYDEFQAMLNHIHFCEYDQLYILGDVCDRGPKSIPLLQEIMKHDNMFLILGNHDLWLRDFADYLIELKNNRTQEIAPKELQLWATSNGGASTIEQFLSLSNPECYDIKTYLEKQPCYQVLSIKQKNYVLVHAGVGPVIQDIHELASVPECILVWANGELGHNPFKNASLVVGHVPTFIYGPSYDGQIIHDEIHHSFHIDGGCVFGHALLCLRLEDEKKFSLPFGKTK